VSAETGSGTGAAGPAGAAGAAEPQALLRVVRGHPTAEELAALVTVLAARSGAGSQPPSGPTSRWADPRRLVGGTVPPVRGGWRSSYLPG